MRVRGFLVEELHNAEMDKPQGDLIATAFPTHSLKWSDAFRKKATTSGMAFPITAGGGTAKSIDAFKQHFLAISQAVR